MAVRRMGLSIRYKILLILTILPLVSLGLYVLMATRLFETDKLAYVFDSSAAVSHSLAVQSRMEMDNVVNQVKPLLEFYDYSQHRFADAAKDVFKKQEKIESLTIYQPNASGELNVIGTLGADASSTIDPVVDTTAKQALEFGLSLHPTIAKDKLYFAQRIGEAQAADRVVYVAVYHSQDLLHAFEEGQHYASFLLSPQGEIVLGPSNLDLFARVSPKKVFSMVLGSKSLEGTGEVMPIEKRKYLVSYSKLPVGDLVVASMVDKNQALQAVTVLVAKSILFFIALLASTVIISLLASVQLTSTIRQLFEATQKVAQGSFDIDVKPHSDDEVGGLAKSFNLMAKEVSRLMSETAEKARMANELATVRTVQETLFPESSHEFGNFEVVGYFEPASECGGDWWNYSMVGDKLFCWIGDATGHGAPAALITGAARSAAAIIETMPDMTPARAMTVMNRAIGETSKGKIIMTFFICMIDLKTGKMTYSSASHDPPFLLRPPEDGKITRKTFVPLVEKSGPRLGDLATAVYEDVEVQMEPGDMLLMYTDGIIDLKNPAGETWGERNFLNNVAKSIQTEETTTLQMDHLKTAVQSYRNNAQLLDDITLVMCQFRRNNYKGKLAA